MIGINKEAALLGAGLIFALSAMAAGISGNPSSKNTSTVASSGGVRAVAAMGRIEPLNGILRLAQPASSYPGVSPVAEIRVKEGDLVKKGSVLAVLEIRSRLETAWRVAVAQAAVAESRLAKVCAGASASEIAAQKAEVERLTVDLDGAKADHNRSEMLRKQEAISELAFQTTQFALESSLKTLEAAKQRLLSMAEVRDVDVELAQAQHAAALAEVEHAKAEIEQAFVRAPADGRIVEIHAYPGELIGPIGLLEFAAVEPVYVVAEVHETDISRVRPGQRASITGSVFLQPVKGVVETVGVRVGKNRVVSLDPAHDSDTRVVEVRIQLDQNEPAARFLQAQVAVVIQP